MSCYCPIQCMECGAVLRQHLWDKYFKLIGVSFDQKNCIVYGDGEMTKDEAIDTLQNFSIVYTHKGEEYWCRKRDCKDKHYPKKMLGSKIIRQCCRTTFKTFVQYD